MAGMGEKKGNARCFCGETEGKIALVEGELYFNSDFQGTE
jgi:hypothetical protein